MRPTFVLMDLGKTPKSSWKPQVADLLPAAAVQNSAGLRAPTNIYTYIHKHIHIHVHIHINIHTFYKTEYIIYNLDGIFQE